MNSLSVEITNMLAQVKEGWCWPEKAIVMANLILETTPDIVVEIGVFGGRSLLPQALAVRSNGKGIIVGIDPWQRDATLEGDVGEANQAWWSNLELHKIHNDFMEHLWRFKLSGCCVVMRNSADECAPLFQPNSVDILHIDGNHTEAVSCRDVNTWIPKMKSRGHIWFDDTNWESTKAARSILDEKCESVKDISTCRLYRVK